MTQEEKQLLLKDLCGRLPYGVKISVNNNVETLQGISALDNVADYGLFLSSDIEEVKPYLFPLSSMTDEERAERATLLWELEGHIDEDVTYKYQDWLNAHHLDYRGLIKRGLAINATGLNIY